MSLLSNDPLKSRTTDELVELQENVYKSLLNITKVAEKSPERTIFIAVATIFNLLYRKVTWVYKQFFMTLANSDTITQVGAEKGIKFKQGNTEVAIGLVTGANSIPIDTQLQFNGLLYNVTANIDNESIRLEADEIGEDYNLEAGNELSFIQNIIGVGTTVLIDQVEIVGVDSETQEEYNQRVIANEIANPQGGNPYSFWQWSTGVNLIVDAYVTLIDYTVLVMPIGEGVGAERILSAEKLLEVVSAIEKSDDSDMANRRPMNDPVSVIAGTNYDINIQINEWSSVASESLETAIEEAVSDYLNALRSVNEGTGKFTEKGSINSSIISNMVNTLTINSPTPFTVVVEVYEIDGSSVIQGHQSIPINSIVGLGTVNYSEA